MGKNQRTSQQNKALHKYFSLVADALNDAGYDIKKTIVRYKIDIPWRPASVKELIWKEVQRSMFNKASTTQLDKQKEITEIYNVINRFLGELGIESIPFPHDEAKEKY